MVDDYSNMVVKKREFLGDLNRGTSKSSEMVVSFFRKPLVLGYFGGT